MPAGRLALGVGTVRPAELHAVTHIETIFPLVLSARIVHAATLVGLGESVAVDAVEYAKQRIQFGTPIGRFQAIKHALADSAVALEIAWNAVLYAALRPSARTADIAALQAKRAADLASRTATQTFGGIAMTWEHPLHLHLKTAQAGRHRFGYPDDHAARLGSGLVSEVESA